MENWCDAELQDIWKRVNPQKNRIQKKNNSNYYRILYLTN